MVLDTSAIVAVILDEPGSELIWERIGDALVVAVGAPTLVESALVLSSRLRRDPLPLLSAFLRGADVEIVPFSHEHFQAAVDAFHRYGKGRHAAALNFGDCLAYAVARIAGMPLLFKGNDFTKTDLAGNAQ